jgi:VTC domain
MSTTASLDWITTAFAPIGLAALNAKAAMLERRDNKYVVRAEVLRSALLALADEFDVLEIDGRRVFTYETCYFDDALRRSFHDHHQGRRQRVKVRVRRYVESGLCYVEVKLKDKRGVTVKRRLPCDAAEYGQLSGAALDHVECSYQALYGRPFGRELEPVLQMRYRRVTLVAREGGERLTIDTGIEFEHQRRDPGTPRTDPEVLILETKSERGNGIADAILRSLGQRPTNGCSKYCVGMSATGQVQRFNRFRPALKKLGTWPSMARLPLPPGFAA